MFRGVLASPEFGGDTVYTEILRHIEVLTLPHKYTIQNMSSISNSKAATTTSKLFNPEYF
jgi:hypothetical protein